MQIDTDNAYDYCKEIAVSHYENFPVGSLLIPSDKRKYIYSIYAFARKADDIADSGIFDENQKLKLLNEFDEELDKVFNKNLTDLRLETAKIFVALSNTIEELFIPVLEFRNLLIAFKRDSVNKRHLSFKDLLDYSFYSANPIGHLVLYVFGYDPGKDSECFQYSDKICTALQLTNFWQDVRRDLEIDRIYIPLNIMEGYNYHIEDLKNGNENDDFRMMMKDLVEKTKEIFNEGAGIVQLTGGRLKLELKATIAGGREILKKIEKINYNVLTERVKIKNLDKIKLLGKIFW